jgi:hypothetical protein
MRVSPRPARVNQSEIRVYLSDPNGTHFGYTKDKANYGLARLAARRLRIPAPFQAAAFKEGFNEYTMARPALRRSDADEEAGIDAHRRAFARAWHWRKYFDVQRRQRRISSAIASARAG